MRVAQPKPCPFCGSTDSFTERAVMERVGKTAAGRLLDNVEHNAMPVAHGR